LGHARMRDERALDLHRAETVAGDVHDVVDAAHHPEVAVLVAACAVAGEVHAGNLAPVLLDVALVVAPNRAQHAGPRLLQDEVTALVRADRLALAVYDVRHDAGERPRARAGLGRDRARKRRDQDAAGF